MAVKILVVDDASFIRDMVKRYLRQGLNGAEIVDANNGQKALSILKSHPIDIILSDWEMPGMTGEELLQWVRADERYQDVPFIMITSRGDRNFVIKAVQAGVSDYISKPFSPEELVKKTLKQVKRIGKENELKASRPHAPGSTEQSSLSILTGGKTEAPKKIPAAPATAVSDSLSALTGGVAKATPAKKSPPPKRAAKALAQLRFSQGSTACVIRDLSLQAMTGVMQRPDTLPTLFDQAAVDIESETGESIARLNGFVYALQAEPRMDAQAIKVSIRFVDNDPDKFEFLSKYISKYF